MKQLNDSPLKPNKMTPLFKVLRTIRSCKTTEQLRNAQTWTNGMGLTGTAAYLIDRTIMAHWLDIVASPMHDIADKVIEAQDRLYDAQLALTEVAVNGDYATINKWAIIVQKCQKELQQWMQVIND